VGVQGLTLKVTCGNRCGTGAYIQDRRGKSLITTNNHVAPGSQATVTAMKDGVPVATTTAPVIRTQGSKEKDVVGVNVGKAFKDTLQRISKPATVKDFVDSLNANSALSKARIGSNMGGGQVNEGSDAKPEVLDNGDLGLNMVNPQGKTGQKGNSGGSVFHTDSTTGEKIFDGNVKARETEGPGRVIAANVNDPETRKVYDQLFDQAA
jgi:hypothetical protein